MAPSDQELALRTQVVGLAMTIFQAGTHYYWARLILASLTWPRTISAMTLNGSTC